MTKKIEFTKAGMKHIFESIAEPIMNAQQYFILLGAKIDQHTQLTFRKQGARSGQPEWRKLSLRTLHPSWKVAGGIALALDRYNKRPGTDGSKTRKYSNNSKTFQASSGFQKSFRILKTTGKKLLYGTKMELAEKIMRKPDSKFHRPVLFITSRDEREYFNMFFQFVFRGIQF